MSDTYAAPRPEQELPLAAVLGVDAERLTVALCNRCGRPIDGHPHAEPDE